MLTSAARRLPGVRFETPSSRLDEALPRMDVAAFVGFAQTGPLHMPVAVEDIRQFEMIFGSEMPLAWDRARGQWVFAHLARAVHAFFANGGQRCWVIRVAGEEARSNQFSVPGLARVVRGRFGGWEISRAVAQARCEGSWSDSLRVSARLQTHPVRIVDASRIAGAPRSFDITAISSPSVAVGDLIRARISGSGEEIFLPVVAATRGRSDVQLVLRTDSPMRLVNMTPTDAEPLTASIDEAAQIVSFDLRVRSTRSPEMRLVAQGFVPGHARYWNRLPTDIVAFRSGSGMQLSQPPFPIAGNEGAKGDGMEETVAFHVPVGMGADFGVETTAEPVPGTRLDRDGLGICSDALFLDAGLRHVAARDLMESADTIRYRAPDPRSLRGIHAALGWNDSPIIEEATLIVVPDAIHRPWMNVEAEAQPEEWFTTIAHAAPEVASGTFGDCSRSQPPKLQWEAPRDKPDLRGTFTLRWEPPAITDGVRYVLEESVLTDFEVVDSTLRTRQPEATLYEREPGTYFYRVRIESDLGQGPWSDTLRIRLPEQRDYEIADDGTGTATTLSVHRALLRMCAARGDLFAPLSLPRHFREDDAIAYARNLARTADTALAAFDDGDPTARAVDSRVASFGAIYHPWVIAHAGEGALGETPPDAVAAGLLAHRARQRGAWIAPANDPLRGVVALSPELVPARWLDLQEARLNIVRREPAAFTVLNADTLSGDPDLRPIHVRRLLSLLQRLALKTGNEFAFEPHDDTLRSAVERRFERLLETLFRRGAFAGRKPEDSFQVTAGVDINPFRSVEQGRLIVELRVRPAQSLRFLTVRLVQAGSQGSVSEVL